MRWVDRGPEPPSVAEYARRFTQGWIDYFHNSLGARPADSHWREFRSLLGSRTNNTCWCCERQYDSITGGRTPTVDHFRPLSRFPESVYEWSNWIFSCQRCNGEYKQDRWPDTGYVDPCADHAAERPEHYFDYDGLVGEIVPKRSLTETARRMALDTIADLGLNDLDVRYYRFLRAERFVAEFLSSPVAEPQALYDSYATSEYGGTIDIVIERLRDDGHI